MRAPALLVSLLALPGLCHAGALYQTFRFGVLGIAWGSTLDQVVGTYPEGDHVFAVTPGQRGYWIKDGATYLGVPRDRQGVLYGFDEEDHVVTVTVAYSFERKEELRSVLTQLLGSPASATTNGLRRTFSWASDAGMRAGVTESLDTHHPILWLTVYAPGYKAVRKDCSSVRR